MNFRGLKMPMPKKSKKYKKPVVSVSLSPALVKNLKAERKPGETRSAQFERLLLTALSKEEQ
jgi:hypothetical protein